MQSIRPKKSNAFQQNLSSKDKKIQNIEERLNKERAQSAQLKEDEETDNKEEIKS